MGSALMAVIGIVNKKWYRHRMAVPLSLMIAAV